MARRYDVDFGEKRLTVADSEVVPEGSATVVQHDGKPMATVPEWLSQCQTRLGELHRPQKSLGLSEPSHDRRLCGRRVAHQCPRRIAVHPPARPLGPAQRQGGTRRRLAHRSSAGGARGVQRTPATCRGSICENLPHLWEERRQNEGHAVVLHDAKSGNRRRHAPASDRGRDHRSQVGLSQRGGRHGASCIWEHLQAYERLESQSMRGGPGSGGASGVGVRSGPLCRIAGNA